MNSVITIVAGVLIAGFIGGVTNYFAIRMLFHPRHEWRIGKWRVPFTPGLIPKRRDEIARSLGRVVSEYLVTSNAFTELLRKDTFQQKLVDRVTDGLRQLAASELTMRELLVRYWPEDKQGDWLASLSRMLDKGTRRLMVYLWTERGLSRLSVEDIVSDWSQESRQAMMRQAADYTALTIKQELLSPSGERLLLRLTTQLIEQSGGFLGAMASIFVDEGKLAAKLQQSLIAALDGGAVRQALERFLEGQLDRSLQLSLGELASVVLGPELTDEAIIDQFGQWLRWEEWLSAASDQKVGDFLNTHMDGIEARLPEIVSTGLRMIEPHVERIFSTLRLEDMVEAQVRDFPIERIEGIILSISGREFRAITWLGVLLGAIIGLVQVILIRWMP